MKQIKYFPIGAKVTVTNGEYTRQGRVASAPVVIQRQPTQQNMLTMPFMQKEVAGYLVDLEQGFYAEDNKSFVSALFVSHDSIKGLTENQNVA
jgi:hypothetical protein